MPVSLQLHTRIRKITLIACLLACWPAEEELNRSYSLKHWLIEYPLAVNWCSCDSPFFSLFRHCERLRERESGLCAETLLGCDRVDSGLDPGQGPRTRQSIINTRYSLDPEKYCFILSFFLSSLHCRKSIFLPSLYSSSCPLTSHLIHAHLSSLHKNTPHLIRHPRSHSPQGRP